MELADAGAADTAAGVITVGSTVKADAWGVVIDDFDGSFTNTKDGKIVSDASATSSVDIAATGAKVATSDGVAVAGTFTMANAVGVSLSGGEDTDDNTQGLCYDCHEGKSLAEAARGAARWGRGRS